MSSEYLVLYGGVLATMLLCRCVPLFLLKGRELPQRVREGLDLIPAAAFAALVANDLLDPEVLVQRPGQGLLPCVAALPVVVISRRRRSLLASAAVGMASYALFLEAQSNVALGLGGFALLCGLCFVV